MIKYALQIIFRRKMRTFLTSLGITIAIVLLGFIIFGMQDLQKLFVNEFNSRFTPNQLIVTRFGGSFATLLGGGTEEKEDKKTDKVVLNDKVINQIRADKRVEKLEALIMISGMQMTLKGKEDAYEQPFISGWDTTKDNSYFVSSYSEKEKPGKGEVFVSTKFIDFYNISKEKVIGKKVIVESSVNSFFTSRTKGTAEKKYTYTITGVFDPGQDQNDAMMSTKEALKILVDIGNYKNSKEYLNEIGYDQLMITVNEDQIDAYKTEFKDKYGYKPISSDEILSFLGNITDGLTVALIGFGLVSAVVASIGIINTMIMSIYEQTKEIGIIKAIGASNTQVLIIFLIQSAVIGLIGGAMGLTLVFAGMKLLDPIVVTELNKAGFAVSTFFTFDLNLGLIIVISSIVVGIVAGLYPAYRASRLDPVRALRYE
jgi:putative ABC transport system permease protein